MVFKWDGRLVGAYSLIWHSSGSAKRGGCERGWKTAVGIQLQSFYIMGQYQ